jgi:hypothetical protein
MSSSAKQHSPRNKTGLQTDQPSHEQLDRYTDRRITSEKACGASRGSLIEHILEFLDHYPSCLTSQPSLAEFTQTC